MDGRNNWSKVKDVIGRNGGSAHKRVCLGAYYDNMLHSDIKHLGFTLSRYKFVSKLLRYKKNLEICELGCQEALGALMFQQNNDLARYVGVDLDSDSIAWDKDNLPTEFEFIESDLFEEGWADSEFDAVISLDMIEHIEKCAEIHCARLLQTT